MKKLMVVVLFVFAATHLASANLLLTENFAYSDGSLTSVSAGVWNRYSGTANNGPVVVSQVAVGGAGADDVRTGFTEQTGDVYFSIDFRITDVGTDDTYLFGFMDGSTMEGGRFFFGTPAGAGDFDVGASVDNAAADGWITGTFALNTWYTMVGHWNGTNTVDAWINPGYGDLATPDLTVVEGIVAYPDNFFIRQGDGWDAGDSSFELDNLRAGTTWGDVVAIPEPSSVLFMAFGVVGLLAARRIRRH
ncbi:MAG: PEP-CTERM sorting domain-containing protein [Kiritimatiellae bacterium]|nr:PEP-CTERM sorting domain-containing protein [Kiritimatiellia bacterium]